MFTYEGTQRVGVSVTTSRETVREFFQLSLTLWFDLGSEIFSKA